MSKLTVIFAILKSKEIKEIAKAAIDMGKNVFAEIKKAKKDNIVTKDERKTILKLALIKFEKVLEKIVLAI